MKEAVHLICQASKVVVCGMGKSGHVAHYLADTFTCTGTPAVYLHAAEALHGGLGIIQPGDVLVIVSRSGAGYRTIAEYMDVPLIALTTPGSELAQLATTVLDCSHEPEHIPHVPTRSIVAAITVAAEFAVAVAYQKGHTPEDTARVHPAGAIGQALH